MTVTVEFLAALREGDHVAVDIGGGERWVGLEFVGPHPTHAALVFRLPIAAQTQNESARVEFPRDLLMGPRGQIRPAESVVFRRLCPHCARVPRDAPEYDDCLRCAGAHTIEYDPWQEPPVGARLTAITFHDAVPDAEGRRRYTLAWISAGAPYVHELTSAAWHWHAAEVARNQERSA